MDLTSIEYELLLPLTMQSFVFIERQYSLFKYSTCTVIYRTARTRQCFGCAWTRRRHCFERWCASSSPSSRGIWPHCTTATSTRSSTPSRHIYITLDRLLIKCRLFIIQYTRSFTAVFVYSFIQTTFTLYSTLIINHRVFMTRRRWSATRRR